MCWLVLQSDAITYSRHEFGISRVKLFCLSLVFFSSSFCLLVHVLVLVLIHIFFNHIFVVVFVLFFIDKKKGVCFIFRLQLPKMFVLSIINCNEMKATDSRPFAKIIIEFFEFCPFPWSVHFQCFCTFYFACSSIAHPMSWMVFVCTILCNDLFDINGWLEFAYLKSFTAKCWFQ